MIDPTLHKYLSDEQKDRLAKLESLFNSDGYKLLMEWAKTNYDGAKHGVLSATSWPDNRIATGSMWAFGELLALQDRTVNEFEAIAEAEQEQLRIRAEDEALEYE